MLAVNALDLVIVLACVSAAIGGYRLGFLTRAAAWAGMCLGVLLAARVAPWVADRVSDGDPNRTLLVTALTLLTGAFVGQLAGQAAGHRLRRGTPGERTAAWDRACGAASGVVVIVAAVWLLTPTLASVPDLPSRLVRGSLLAQRIDDLTPDPPDPVRAASRLIGRDQWDRLAGQFTSGLPTAAPPDGVEPPAEVDAAARAATVRVERGVCGQGVQFGTGFVAKEHLIVTNAHVVAGGGGPVTVEGQDGETHEARVVVFEPASDLAVLRVESFDAAPLPLATRAEADSTGWVYGHPEGGDLERTPFRAGAESEAEVPDIYGTATLTRRIVPLRAELVQGYSGSALVDPEGRVVGVAFAVSPDEDDVAVAIAMDAVDDALAAAEAIGPDGPAVSTGECLPES